MPLSFVRAVFLALATFYCGSSSLLAKATWLKASTDEVTVISDAPKNTVTEYVVKYSAFRQAFSQLFAPADRRPPPMVLLLFKDPTELKEHLVNSKENVINFSTEIDQTALTALACSSSAADDLAAAFEFDTIWLLRRVGYFLPLWMAQGTGEILATLRVKNNLCIIDANRSPSDTLWSSNRGVPWQKFFDYYQTTPEYKGPNADGTPQAQAWALMTAILFKEKTPRDQFVRLAGLLRNREGIQAAGEMLGVPADQFTLAVQRQLRQNTVVTTPFEEKPLLSRMHLARADDREVNVYRGEVLIANGRIAEGNRLIDEAVRQAPHALESNEAMARRALRDKNNRVAARYYRAAIEAGTTNVNAFLVSAAEYLDPTSSVSDPADATDKNPTVALVQVRRAMELNPGDTRARILLGQAYVAAGKPTEDGLTELSEAITEDETGLEIRYYRGLVYERLGRTGEAFADFDFVVRHPATSSLTRSLATNSRMPLLFDADRKTFDELLANGKYDQARALVEQRIGETEKTPAEKAYRKMRDWLDETQLWAAAVARYNSKDFAGALEAAHNFVRVFPNSSRIRDANRMVATVEAVLKKKTEGK